MIGDEFGVGVGSSGGSVEGINGSGGGGEGISGGCCCCDGGGRCVRLKRFLLMRRSRSICPARFFFPDNSRSSDRVRSTKRAAVSWAVVRTRLTSSR